MIQQKEGMILIVVLITIVIVSTVALGLRTVVSSSQQGVTAELNRNQALFLADGAASYIIDFYPEFLIEEELIEEEFDRSIFNEAFLAYLEQKREEVAPTNQLNLNNINNSEVAGIALGEIYLELIDRQGNEGLETSTFLLEEAEVVIQDIEADLDHQPIIEVTATSQINNISVTVRQELEFEVPGWMENSIGVVDDEDNLNIINEDQVDIDGPPNVMTEEELPDFAPDIFEAEGWSEEHDPGGNTGYNTDQPWANIMEEIWGTWNYTSLSDHELGGEDEKNKVHQEPTALYFEDDVIIDGRHGLHLGNHYIIAEGDIMVDSQALREDDPRCPVWCEESDTPQELLDDGLEEQPCAGEEHQYTPGDGLLEDSLLYAEGEIEIRDPAQHDDTSSSDGQPHNPEADNHNFHLEGVMMAEEGVTFADHPEEVDGQEIRDNNEIEHTVNHSWLNIEMLQLLTPGQDVISRTSTGWEIIATPEEAEILE